MKFQTILRTQLAIAGLGAALLFAGTARGQEIVNTRFPDGQNAVPFTQVGPEQQTVNSDANTGAALPGSEAYRAMSTLAPTQESTVAEEPKAESWLMGALLASIAAIALYALAVAKRLTREVDSRTDSYVANPGA